MERRPFLAGIAAALGAVTLPGHAQSAAPGTLRSIAVIDFELVDDQNNPGTKEATLARLPRATALLQRELTAHRLYRVVDPAASAALQARLRQQQEYIYRCDDCVLQIGTLLGVDLAMSTWVQKVSELILNLNVQIHSMQTGKLILSKSVDMRGNQDTSWDRAVTYLVRDMAAKRAVNPDYGT
jgi:hypothetical protein